MNIWYFKNCKIKIFNVYIGQNMILTTHQIQHLHTKSYKDLLEVYNGFKKYTKQLSKKSDLVTSIENIIQQFNLFRAVLGKELNTNLKQYTKSNISDMEAVDLRQAHASFRQSLQCGKKNKANIIQAFLRLSKQINFFIMY